jgi:hypothetical protein
LPYNIALSTGYKRAGIMLEDWNTGFAYETNPCKRTPPVYKLEYLHQGVWRSGTLMSMFMSHFKALVYGILTWYQGADLLRGWGLGTGPRSN